SIPTPPRARSFPYTTLFRSASKYGSASRFIMNRRRYGARGLAYTRITNKGFSVRLMPPGQIFSGAGLAVFLPTGADAESLCGLLDRKSTRLNSSHQIISYAV